MSTGIRQYAEKVATYTIKSYKSVLRKCHRRRT
jgi:hypothetical protein